MDDIYEALQCPRVANVWQSIQKFRVSSRVLSGPQYKVEVMTIPRKQDYPEEEPLSWCSAVLSDMKMMCYKF